MANERRLIDANALQSELVERQYHDQTMGILHSYYPHFRDIVANQPTVDAVEVRCKDCKYYTQPSSASLFDYPYCALCYNCDGTHTQKSESDFCSYGEKRESGTQPQREDV